MKKNKTMCYVAPTSGGDVIAGLTLAQEENRKHPDTCITLITGSDAHIQKMVSSHHTIAHHMSITYNAHTNYYHLYKLCIQTLSIIIKACYFFIRYRPTQIICSTDFPSFLIALCARMLAIPVTVYMYTAQPKSYMRLFFMLTKEIHTCFSPVRYYVSKKKLHKTAYPIRFFTCTKQVCQQQAVTEIKFDQHKKTIFITGGTQGSLHLNTIISTWLTEHQEIHHKLQIIHQVGTQDTYNLKALYAQLGIPAYVFTFNLDIALYYSAADIIICHGGSGTLFESLFFGKICISIPYDQEHLHNAYALQQQHDDLFFTIHRSSSSQTVQQLHTIITEHVYDHAVQETHRAYNQL